MAKLKKIGVLGGAFNPPHFGHLKIAKFAQKKLKLDKLIFIPAGIPPLKKSNLAPAKDRLKMTSFLIEGNKNFEVSDYEIKKKKKSYTIETISYLKRKFKNCQIFWIIGEDSLREIIEEKWKGKLKVLDLANFVVFTRPNHKFRLKKLLKKFEKNKEIVLKKVILIKKRIPISATKIREKIKKGENVEKFLPKKVLDYIKEKKLYV
jgi:nicotinate-nucleotide adenylyltransferase